MHGSVRRLKLISTALIFLVGSTGVIWGVAHGAFGWPLAGGSTQGRCPAGAAHQRDPWTTFRHDPQNTARSCDAASFAAAPALVWSLDPVHGLDGTRAHVAAAMAEQNGALYAAVDQENAAANAYQGTVLALDSATGARRWSYINPATNDGISAGYIEAAPALASVAGETRLLASTWNAGEVALGATDGRARWATATGTQMFASAVAVTPRIGRAATPLIIAPGQDGHLYAFKAGDGSLFWKYPNDSTQQAAIMTNPAVSRDGSTIYAATAGDYRVLVTAYDITANPPAIRWRIDVDAGHRWFDNASAPLVVDPATGDLYMATSLGQVYAFDPRNGHQKWLANLDDHGPNAAYGILAAMAFDPVRQWLFLAGAAGLTGGQANYAVWRFSGLRQPHPVVISRTLGSDQSYAASAGLLLTRDGQLLVATGASMEGSGGHLLAYDESLDRPLWQLDFPAGIVASPIIADGRLFLGADNGVISAYVPASQAPKVAVSPAVVTAVPAHAPVSIQPPVAVAGDGSWPMFRGNAQHTGVAAGETRITARTAGALNLAVVTPVAMPRVVPAPFESSPSVVGDTIYVGADNNTLYALAPGGGLRWLFRPISPQVSPRMYASPAVYDGTVFQVSGDGNFYAVDAATGNQMAVTRISADGTGYASPVYVAENSAPHAPIDLYVAAGSTYAVYRYDPASPHQFTLKWSAALDSDIWNSPVVDAAGTSYVATSNPDCSFYAFTPQGTLLWRHRISFYPFEDADAGGAGLALDIRNGILLGGSNKHAFYALDARTGQVVWSHATTPGANFVSVPAVADGYVYAGADDGLYAFSESDGTVAWVYHPPSAGFTASPTVIEDASCAGCRLVVAASFGHGPGKGGIYILNGATGAVVAHYADGAESFLASPTVSHGTIYAGAFGSPKLYTLCAAGSC